MSSERKRPGIGFVTFAVLTLAGLYVLSSGPARLVRTQEIEVWYSFFTPPDEPHPTARIREPGKWWHAAYRPLAWVGGQPWGAPLRWYWSLFPLQSELVSIQLGTDEPLRPGGPLVIHRTDASQPPAEEIMP